MSATGHIKTCAMNCVNPERACSKHIFHLCTCVMRVAQVDSCMKTLENIVFYDSEDDSVEHVDMPYTEFMTLIRNMLMNVDVE